MTPAKKFDLLPTASRLLFRLRSGDLMHRPRCALRNAPSNAERADDSTIARSQRASPSLAAATSICEQIRAH